MEKVVLRLQKGILTKLINIPQSCLRTEFRMPVARFSIGIATIREIQNHNPYPTVPTLIFRWDGKSTATGKHYPIMDLVNVENY